MLPNDELTMREAIAAINAGNNSALTADEKNNVSGTFGVADTINLVGTGTITFNTTQVGLNKPSPSMAPAPAC